MRIGVIIPALNEEPSVGDVVSRCLKQCTTRDEMRVVVCDNGSKDRTADAARKNGAEVVDESYRGYGAACLRAIEALGEWPDVFVFIDADGSSRPEEMHRLLQPLRENAADLVLGRRDRNSRALLPQQRFAAWLAARLIWYRWGVRYQDLGPFRAIRREAYERLGMSDLTWGWTVEMQILAILRNLRTREVDMAWERRIAGRSKISGDVVGATRAGFKIFWTIFLYAVPSSNPQSHC